MSRFGKCNKLIVYVRLLLMLHVFYMVASETIYEKGRGRKRRRSLRKKWIKCLLKVKFKYASILRVEHGAYLYHQQKGELWYNLKCTIVD